MSSRRKELVQQYLKRGLVKVPEEEHLDITLEKATLEVRIVNPPKLELTFSVPRMEIIGEAQEDVRIHVYKPRVQEISRRMRRTSFQGRLGRKVDNLARRISDNSIRLSSHPTDMLRIHVDRDERSQDLLARTIIGAEVVPVMLPVMKDVPLRQFSREGSRDVLIPSFYPINDAEFYTVYAPLEVQLDEDDLLLRVVYKTYCDEPYVMALQVKEVLSTIGYSSVLYNKVNVTFYDEELPDKVIEIIKEANLKRDILGW